MVALFVCQLLVFCMLHVAGCLGANPTTTMCAVGDGQGRMFWLPCSEPSSIKCGKVTCAGPDAVCVQIWGAADTAPQEPQCLTNKSEDRASVQMGQVCRYTEKAHAWHSQSLRTCCTADASVPLTLHGKATNVSLCCCREADCKDMSPLKPTTTISTGSSTMDGSEVTSSDGPPITDQNQPTCDGGLNKWMVVSIILMVLFPVVLGILVVKLFCVSRELAVYAEACEMLILCNEPLLEDYNAPTRNEKMDQALASLKRRVSANLKYGICVRDQLGGQQHGRNKFESQMPDSNSL